jgi:mannose-6-phosphate isomerase-like protein (cupin superfamily)
MNKNIKTINIAQKLMQFSDVWSPKIISELNDSYIKVAKFHGEYVWHKHNDEDELFIVITGTLKIQLRDSVIHLNQGELVVIPKGIEHRPVADSEVNVLLIELKSTISTGDTRDTESKKATHGEWI